MSLATWRAAIEPAVQQVIQNFDLSEEGARRALFAVDALLSDHDGDFHNVYSMLQESSLDRQRDRWLRDLSSGSATIRPDLTDTDMVVALGGLARALDALLAEYIPFLGPPQLEQLTHDDMAGYVLRRKRPRPSVRLKPNQGYSKRGLVYHRTVPKVLRGHTVSIHLAGSVAVDKSRLPEHGVAAAFPDLQLHTAVTGQKQGQPLFRATGTTVPNLQAVLDDHFAELVKPGVFMGVWPELTVEAAKLELIVDRLGAQRLLEDHSDLQVLVAGSWHVERDGAWWNSAPVLDGYGTLVTTYEKVTPFYSSTAGYEDVALGGRIPVIVTDDYVIAVAICKDFCDLNRSKELSELDVDLFLVPSMGGHTTMSGHQTMAKQLAVQPGSLAFVVQQPDGSVPNPPTAWVLPMAPDPNAPGTIVDQIVNADRYEGKF